MGCWKHGQPLEQTAEKAFPREHELFDLRIFADFQ